MTSSRRWLATVNETLASPLKPGYVRLVAVDGTTFADPLPIEGIDAGNAEIGDALQITVWSHGPVRRQPGQGWMFMISVAAISQWGREIVLEFEEDC
jgi:hypothetical protein